MNDIIERYQEERFRLDLSRSAMFTLRRALQVNVQTIWPSGIPAEQKSQSFDLHNAILEALYPEHESPYDFYLLHKLPPVAALSEEERP